MKLKQISFGVGLTASLLLVGVFVVWQMALRNVQSNEVVQTADQVVAQNTDLKPEPEKGKEDSKDVKRRSGLQKPNVTQSPKQIEVKNSVSEEKLYYILSQPNDPLYSSGWAMQNINAPDAWDVTTGSSDVVVAVLDSGFALDHQDLTDRWYVNPGESGGGKETDGIDNDSNGYIDDFRGWDFYTIDNNPQAGTVNPVGDGVSHGSEVAGLVGATGDNGLGVAAAGWNTTLMPLQVMSDEGSGYSSDITAAIYYAVDSGADVINMSLGTSGDDPSVRSAVDYAVQNNVVVVAAAGNCGNNNEGPCAGQVNGYVTFPGSYEKVIAVGAVGQTNSKASFSSYGQRLDIVAPGSGTIASTTWTAGNGTSAYASSLYGTSFASPITAGATALIKSIRPSSSVDDIRALLMGSSQKVSGMSNVFYTSNYGHGLLDIGKSIEIATGLNTITELEPEVYQAGNNTAEGRYAISSSLGSGCKVATGTWCSIRLRNTSQNYDRFLPYGLTDGNDEFGWTWSGSALQHGEWEVRAVQGEKVSSTPVLLFSK
jgi:subtilisin family serine protease